MSEPKEIRRHKDPRENARAIHDYLDATYAEDRLFEVPYLNALYNDVGGLLAGISQGTIKTGQPRIVEQLIRIVQDYPKDRDPETIIEAISAVSEFGLAADRHPLPGVLRTPMDNER